MRQTRTLALLIVVLIFSLLACFLPITEMETSIVPTNSTAVSEPLATTTTAPLPVPESQPSVPPSADLPASGPLTIVTLGDSLTEGQGDDSGPGGYPPRLQTLIEVARPGTQVINFGHSGWAAPDLINGLNDEPSQLEQALAIKAHIVIVWIGSNDLWYLYEFGPDPITAEAEQQDLQAYEVNINIILWRLTQSGVKVFIALLDDQSRRAVVANPPNPAEPAFTSTSADDLARMSAHVTAYNEIIQRKAAQYGAITVDFYSTDIFTNPATIYDDGNHPNTSGYEKITQLWFAALEPYIQ